MANDKQKHEVRASGLRINGSATPDTTFTSDPIKMPNKPWSLNVWFTSLVANGKQPTVQIEVSNDEPNATGSVSVLSFNDLQNAFGTVPRGFKSEFFKYKYIRIVYTPNSATNSGLMYFDLIQEL